MNELPKLRAVFDEQLGSCIEMEYAFDDYYELSKSLLTIGREYHTDDATVKRRVETRVRIPVNSIILAALDAYRNMDVPEFSRRVTIKAHVHKVTCGMID